MELINVLHRNLSGCPHIYLCRCSEYAPRHEVIGTRAASDIQSFAGNFDDIHSITYDQALDYLSEADFFIAVPDPWALPALYKWSLPEGVLTVRQEHFAPCAGGKCLFCTFDPAFYGERRSLDLSVRIQNSRMFVRFGKHTCWYEPEF